MVDIETMGNQSYSSIISLGAVEFDLETGKTGSEFYRNISLQSCLSIGLTVSADTIMWWIGQGEQAQKSLVAPQPISITSALEKFTAFCRKESYHLWGNSARFDLGILQNAFDKAKLPVCWDFRNERDVRTLVSFAPHIKENLKFEGTKHNALADCYHQIKYCHLIWKALKNK